MYLGISVGEAVGMNDCTIKCSVKSFLAQICFLVIKCPFDNHAAASSSTLSNSVLVCAQYLQQQDLLQEYPHAHCC